ncbi:MAG: cell division protein FtsZ [Minisyncoccia bacterium]
MKNKKIKKHYKTKRKKEAKKKEEKRIILKKSYKKKGKKDKAKEILTKIGDKKINIKIIGVGGAGGNMVSRMKEKRIEGVEFVALNTDIQSLRLTKADVKIQLGKNTCRGLGAGMDPDKGKEAAQESLEEIEKVINNTDLVFLVCGLGGGTGSGAAPVIANLLKQKNILTVAFVTRPFSFEGEKRQEVAEEAWQRLYNEVDSIVTIYNDRVFNVIEEKTPILEAFSKIDDILRMGVKGIVDLIFYPGLINLDYANIKTILTNAGVTLMGIGKATGENRARKAAQMAISSPLLDVSIDGAKKILFNISGGKDLTLVEIHDASRIITQTASKDAQVIFGTSFDNDLKQNEVKVTVIAGLGGEEFKELYEPTLPLATKVPVESPSETEKEEESGEEFEKELEIPAFLRKQRKNK